MKINTQQNVFLTWGGIGLVTVAVGYVVIKWVIPAIANAAASSASKAAGSLASGVGNTVGSALNGLSSNQLTQGGSSDFSGAPIDYSQAGPIGTVAAAENKLSGGLLASGGEIVGSGLFSLFGPKPPSNITYIVGFPDGSRHAVNADAVDSNNRFTYSGQQYVLGDDGSGNKVATALTTIYGSGSGGGIPTDFGLVDPSSW